MRSCSHGNRPTSDGHFLGKSREYAEIIEFFRQVTNGFECIEPSDSFHIDPLLCESDFPLHEIRLRTLQRQPKRRCVTRLVQVSQFMHHHILGDLLLP